MKRLLSTLTGAVILLWIVAATVSTEQADSADPVTIATSDGAEFIGTARCKTCHRKEESGEQFQKWEASAHAQAYATLGTPKAKEVAAAKGIADPQAADECLQCHVTGHGVPAELLGPKYSVEDGVGCESCHGAGGNYYKKSTMESITSGEVEGASVGLVTPTEETCVKCHNEKSPSFKGFNFEEYSAKIAHPIPEATKAEYK